MIYLALRRTVKK